MDPGSKCRTSQAGLSAVVATLIILVASVVLGISLVLYASGVFEARVQEEAIEVELFHLWINSTDGGAEGAFLVKNVGARDTGVSAITIRGTLVPFVDVYFWKVSDSVDQDLQFDSAVVNASASSLNITIYPGKSETFAQATGAIGISPGEEVVIYIDSPGSIAAKDVGEIATNSVKAGQASIITQTPISTVT